jgi:hypothetical protein
MRRSPSRAGHADRELAVPSVPAPSHGGPLPELLSPGGAGVAGWVAVASMDVLGLEPDPEPPVAAPAIP